MKLHPAYADSGVAWLGALPADWDVSTLGFEAWVRARLGWKGLKAEEYVDDGYVLLSTPNIKHREIDFESVNYINRLRYDESPEIQLRIGDVLLAKDGSTLGTVNVVSELPRPTTVNSSIAVISPGARLLGSYLRYVFSSSFMQATIASAKGGMGVPHLFQADIVKFKIPRPALAEQRLISEYLDRELTQIDVLLNEQGRLNELLKEKRQAVISHAVTKGMNSKVRMQPSGVDALGGIPADWHISRLKYAISKIEQGWSPQCENEPARFGEWGVLKVGCGNRDRFDPTQQKALPADVEPIEAYEIQNDDILMSRGNTQELVGMATLVEGERARLLLSDLLYRFRGREGVVLPRFLVFALRSPNLRFQIEATATGTSASMKKISQGDIRELLIALPPIDEQHRIVAFLMESNERFDALIAEAERAIDLLQERRSALITAAVTGQIDVRQSA